MMRRSWIVVSALLSGLVTLGLAVDALAQAKKIIRAGITDPLETPHGQGMVEFKKIVEKETGGAIQVQLFPSNQLGTIVEQIENVRQGGQEMSMSTPAWFTRFYARIDMLEMPYLLTDWDQAERLFVSDAFKKVAADAEREASVRIMGVLPNGFRNVINKRRAIASLADFKGLKVRLQNSPVHLATFRALGANPVAVAWNETYQAVQTGVVDGLENANGILLTHKFYEVASYVSNTRHFFGVLLVYMNPKFHDGLTTEQKAIVERAMRAAEAVNLKAAKEAEAQAVAGLQKTGAKVNDLSADTLETLRKAVQPVYDEFGPKFQPDLAALQKAVARK